MVAPRTCLEPRTTMLIISWLLQEVFNTIYFQLFGDQLPELAMMRAVGTVSKLCVYPLKSGRRVEADEVSCEQMGPHLGDTADRSLVVTDEEGGFLTGRRHPELVLVAAEVLPDGVRLSAPDTPPLVVRPAEGGRARPPLRGAHLVRPRARLRWFPLRRSARRPHVPPFPVRTCDGSAFADLAGYMLMNEASVAELNGRLERPVGVDAFRANVVIAGADAFAEDRWRYLAIGDAMFENVKPCTRCLFVTIDPETAVKDAEAQPLKTLRQYRQSSDPAQREVVRDSPLFGINLGLRRRGVIRVGDVVYATEK
ncbi:mitochondrial amidoxime-reducing component 1-like [Pollicipes pollicipes]|uniref:mitochondrial amidoxime-reducing component 1-like n=1 Tax=Pollicipes pollicipes TaxID=41117 RepID=UPI0018856323|nr:mitochondrial amidoxime-reducing component 1-like [Pollicipes pollicipes]